MMKKSFLVTILASGIGFAAACVGSDPDPVSPAVDGGGATSSGASGSGTTSSGSSGTSSGSTSGSTDDAPCDLAADFEPATLFPGVNTPADEADLRYTPDGQFVYFVRGDFAGNSGDIMRASAAKNFADAVVVDGINHPGGTNADGTPNLTIDGLSIIASCNDGPGNATVFKIATRPQVGQDGGAPFAGRKTMENSPQNGFAPWLTYDGQAIYYSDLTAPQHVIKRVPYVGGVLGEPKLVLADTNRGGNWPIVTGDDKTLYYVSENGDRTLTVATKEGETFAKERPVKGLEKMIPSWVSRDGCTLVGAFDTDNAKSELFIAEKPKKKP